MGEWGWRIEVVGGWNNSRRAAFLENMDRSRFGLGSFNQSEDDFMSFFVNQHQKFIGSTLGWLLGGLECIQILCNLKKNYL